MLSVPCTLVHADGAVEHTAFRMTAPKLATLEAKGADAIDAFLRSKVTHKGYHGSWQRYGSWTLQDEGGEETYLFAWAYGKGAAPHAKCYTLGSEAMQVYDDVLLLRFPALDTVTLAEAMALTEPQVSGWLGCIAVAAQAASKVTPAAKGKGKSKGKRKAKKKKPKPAATTASVQLPVKDDTAVFEVEEEGLLKDGSVTTATFALADPANDDASGSDDDELPVVASTAATTAQSDDEDNEEDNDDEDDVADGPIDTAVFDLEEGDAEVADDEEDDDDAEPAVDVLEAHMLQYEDYEYHDKTIPCQLPSLYSLWTSVG